MLVPVNSSSFPSAGTDLSVVAKRLNEIYSPAVVNWHVSYDHAIEVGKVNEEDFKVEGTSMLSKYTPDMNKVIRKYKRERPTDDNTMYLFFLNIPDLGSNRKGFMPLAGNYGFIFNFGTDLELLAHELAHGAFNLRHTFSPEALIAKEFNTQNLMDYNGGSELWKHQWDYIHDPQTMLFAWAQDEEEGAFVFGETAIENILRAVRNVRCAKTNNAETANLYFGNYSYSIEIKDLVTAFNWAGSDVSDEKIKFYISNDGEINLDYFEDDFDVKNIQYNDSKHQVVLKGKKRSLFVEPDDAYSDQKAQVYSFIKTMFDGSVSIKEPTATEVNGMELDKLRYLSVCQLALMSDDKRKETLKSISGQTAITAKDEKLVINLLRTTKDKTVIYSLLKDNKTAIDLYNGLNTYKQEFVYLFNWICEVKVVVRQRVGLLKVRAE